MWVTLGMLEAKKARAKKLKQPTEEKWHIPSLPYHALAINLSF
jgi:hypothetical protein